MIRVALTALVLALAPAGVPAGAVDVEAGVPIDDRLTYRVTWLGLHCADMTLESRPVEGKPALVRMVMSVTTTPLFDGIYRVRSTIESTYHVRWGTTLRYHETSLENEREKDDLWVVRVRAGRAKRTKNGAVQVFDIPPGGVHDPLAMIYRFRAMLEEPGDEAALAVMTSEGAVEARAVAHRWERFETASGPVNALKVVQAAVEDAEFARGGGLTMWLSSRPDRRPHRIDFELPFGKLVAELVE